MSFSNLSLAPATPLNKSSDAIKLSIFIIKKLHVIEIVDEALINLSRSPDKQFVLYLLNDFEKIKMFLTWWNETSYAIALNAIADS